MMSSRFLKIGAVLLAGAAVSFAATLDAANIVTGGVICRNFNASQALDIDYLTSGVRNINAAARTVICPVPRSPLAAGDTPLFHVAGRNNPGTQTTCTLFVHNGLGTFVASQSFTVPGSNPPLWILNYSFPVGTVGASHDVSALCTLPGNGNGIIYRVTSFQ
jgi:hypothetical protein